MTARKSPARKSPAKDPEQVSSPAARESNSVPNSPRPVWEAGESRSEYHARVHAWKLAQRS